ncbi:transposase [Tamlana sp. 2_MG-2023]|uniref:transposase n=1 Tax=unclassified Tamlana TaxID=2614803 RepID=UPI0026E44CCD|nr:MULTISPECIES: transposase [unclassified Tamlana]MDO6760922.1 transposase [Tamlana sp. 2_MG-2023]MDO6791178.1 transposase [Tamlana sp. 1_MG-2023]
MQTEKLVAGHYYHIYNRGNNGQNIFIEAINYSYFLDLIKRHLLPDFKILSFCLLPNHFHLLLKINEDCPNPSQNLSNLFNAYTKGINKKYDRTGSLLEKPFKRICILNEAYLRTLILYIHLNPEHHQIHNNFSTYKYSSYQSIISQAKTNLQREEVINLFDDINNFKETHLQKKVIINIENENLILE